MGSVAERARDCAYEIAVLIGLAAIMGLALI